MHYQDIVFVANSSKSVIKYRQPLVRKLSLEACIEYRSIFLLPFCIKIWKKGNVLVSSDTIANLLALIIPIPLVLILNGFGRLERIKLMRLTFIFLINSKRDVNVCVQNYRDYRYLRKYINKELNWIPGSGGCSRTIGKNDYPVMITRDRKYPLQKKFLEHHSKIFCKICIVGLRKKQIYNDKCISLGVRKQSEIFKGFNKFLQPDGYGEGIPHSLVDAICSNMDIYISKKSWINYGFYKLVDERLTQYYYYGDLVLLKHDTKMLNLLKNQLKLDSINEKYSNAIRGLAVLEAR